MAMHFYIRRKRVIYKLSYLHGTLLFSLCKQRNVVEASLCS